MENLAKKIKEEFKEKVEIIKRNKRRYYIIVDKETSYNVNKYIFLELKGRLATASAVDKRDVIEINYHYGMDRDCGVITVKTTLDKSDLKINTISDFTKAACWIEREINELFGVEFVGHKDMKPLLLPEDWEPGVYPLRKDEKGVEIKAPNIGD